MLKSVKTILNFGSNGIVIEAECHLSNGLPGITIVGLGTKAIDEARERLRSAFASSQMAMPRKRITINLAPADIPKDSTSLDLPMALSILQTDGQLEPIAKNTAALGELGLDGYVRPIRGVIGKILAGKLLGIEKFIIPEANLVQASLVPNIYLIPAKNLESLVHDLRSGHPNIRHTKEGQKPTPQESVNVFRLSDVVGQHKAKRALQIAAAGGHNVFLNGPPGTGKSMMAKAILSIMPELTQQEMLEVTQLHSLIGGSYEQLVTNRPFRSPHHSASHVSIIGGGNTLRPGEISLAHRGVLLLDEFPEFSRSTLESLRQPLEDQSITVSRAKESAVYPADFIMIATANPCPCGYYNTNKACTCPAYAITKYRQKLSGPIMDRIDLYSDVQQIDHDLLLNITPGDNEDQDTKKLVTKARERQAKRFGSNTKLNSNMTNQDIKSKSNISKEAQKLLNNAAKTLELSARSYMRIIKVARSIADLEDTEQLDREHMSEALQYRSPKDPVL